MKGRDGARGAASDGGSVEKEDKSWFGGLVFVVYAIGRIEIVEIKSEAKGAEPRMKGVLCCFVETVVPFPGRKFSHIRSG